MSTPAKKAPAKKQAVAKKVEWKADFGGVDAKPASVLYTVATKFGEVDGKVKLQGDNISDTAKKAVIDLQLTGENDVKVVVALLRSACGVLCSPPDDISPHEKFLPALQFVKQVAATDTKVRKAMAEFVAEQERIQAEKAAAAGSAGKAAIAVNEKRAESLAEKTNDLVANKIASIKGIEMVNGKFVLSADIGDAEIAEGLTMLSSMIGSSEDLVQGFALREAQFAMAVEDTGRDWKLYYDLELADQAKDAKRIGQAVRSLRRLEVIQREMPTARISLIRTAMEAKYSKDEASNTKRAQGVVDKLNAYNDKHGKYPPQLEVRGIVNDAKEGNSTPKRPVWVYIIAPIEDDDNVRVVGTQEENKGLAELSVACIHIGSVAFKVEGKDKEGNKIGVAGADSVKIPEPDQALLELAAQYEPEVEEAEEVTPVDTSNLEAEVVDEGEGDNGDEGEDPAVAAAEEAADGEW